MTQALQELHWLPIAQRIIDYKLCLLVYKSRTGSAPVYVSDMLAPAADVTSRAMRSSTNCDYFVRRTTLRLGDRAFSVADPRAWNRLPSELKTTTCSIETFKRRLKTFFYYPRRSRSAIGVDIVLTLDVCMFVCLYVC